MAHATFIINYFKKYEQLKITSISNMRDGYQEEISFLKENLIIY